MNERTFKTTEVEVFGNKYQVKILPAFEAFELWEEYIEGRGDSAGLMIELINRCIVEPEGGLELFNHPFEITSMGNKLLDLHFIYNDAKIKQKTRKLMPLWRMVYFLSQYGFISPEEISSITYEELLERYVALENILKEIR